MEFADVDVHKPTEQFVTVEVPEGPCHNVVKGAVESERESMCGTLPSDLEEPIARGEGLRTECACMTFGTVQNKVPEDMGHSTVK